MPRLRTRFKKISDNDFIKTTSKKTSNKLDFHGMLQSKPKVDPSVVPLIPFEDSNGTNYSPSTATNQWDSIEEKKNSYFSTSQGLQWHGTRDQDQGQEKNLPMTAAVFAVVSEDSNEMSSIVPQERSASEEWTSFAPFQGDVSIDASTKNTPTRKLVHSKGSGGSSIQRKRFKKLPSTTRLKPPSRDTASYCWGMSQSGSGEDQSEQGTYCSTRDEKTANNASDVNGLNVPTMSTVSLSSNEWCGETGSSDMSSLGGSTKQMEEGRLQHSTNIDHVSRNIDETDHASTQFHVHSNAGDSHQRSGGESNPAIEWQTVNEFSPETLLDFDNITKDNTTQVEWKFPKKQPKEDHASRFPSASNSTPEQSFGSAQSKSMEIANNHAVAEGSGASDVLESLSFPDRPSALNCFRDRNSFGDEEQYGGEVFLAFDSEEGNVLKGSLDHIDDQKPNAKSLGCLNEASPPPPPPPPAVSTSYESKEETSSQDASDPHGLSPSKQRKAQVLEKFLELAAPALRDGMFTEEEQAPIMKVAATLGSIGINDQTLDGDERTPLEDTVDAVLHEKDPDGQMWTEKKPTEANNEAVDPPVRTQKDRHVDSIQLPKIDNPFEYLKSTIHEHETENGSDVSSNGIDVVEGMPTVGDNVDKGRQEDPPQGQPKRDPQEQEQRPKGQSESSTTEKINKSKTREALIDLEDSPCYDDDIVTETPLGASLQEIEYLNQFLKIAGSDIIEGDLSIEQRERIYESSLQAGVPAHDVNRLLDEASGIRQWEDCSVVTSLRSRSTRRKRSRRAHYGNTPADDSSCNTGYTSYTGQTGYTSYTGRTGSYTVSTQGTGSSSSRWGTANSYYVAGDSPSDKVSSFSCRLKNLWSNMSNQMNDAVLGIGTVLSGDSASVHSDEASWDTGMKSMGPLCHGPRR